MESLYLGLLLMIFTGVSIYNVSKSNKSSRKLIFVLISTLSLLSGFSYIQGNIPNNIFLNFVLISGICLFLITLLFKRNLTKQLISNNVIGIITVILILFIK